MDYLKIYNTLDSTNKEAQRLLATGPVENGLTLLAKNQTAGRGQYGRHWISATDHHLAMSIIYKPTHFDVSQLPTIGMKVSLAIVRSLKNIAPALNPLIKWPNDIYLKGKKLCGILIENAISGSSVQHSIIGIGMNINEVQFPLEIPNAISLFQATGDSHDMEKTALVIRQTIMAILEGNDPNWKSEYDRSLYGADEKHHFQSDHEQLEALVQGVSLEGHLILELQDGTIRPFATHELKWEIR
jgi:BirA family biotin operon repressor/biotin-[acetyl-CoA-carboxylase] ligase